MHNIMYIIYVLHTHANKIIYLQNNTWYYKEYRYATVFCIYFLYIYTHIRPCVFCFRWLCFLWFFSPFFYLEVNYLSVSDLWSLTMLNISEVTRKFIISMKYMWYMISFIVSNLRSRTFTHSILNIFWEIDITCIVLHSVIYVEYMT